VVKNLVELVSAFLAGILATFVPLFIGLFIPNGLLKVRAGPRAQVFLAAFSVGIIFWFFLDVMGDAALLDVNQGFRADDYYQAASHIVLALLFAIGLGILVMLDRRFRKPGTGENTAESNRMGMPFTLTFAIASVAALGIGFHSLGEGIGIGSNLPNSADILEAIGGILPGVAYVLHKFLEGFVVGVFAVLASAVSARKLGILGIISGVPTVIGFILGLPSGLDSSYFFAMGAAGAVYIEIRLLPLIFRGRFQYFSVVPLLLGFYAMYFAGLFHG